ncbi:stalk domain-containing protein [Paenibacillus sp. FSL L8-0463]|uniref:stalk domain-containing protein n=1 Tax=Paenibacillus sp. FSL L8-0463 TaxID=2954687 RepID=UPI00311A8615
MSNSLHSRLGKLFLVASIVFFGCFFGNKQETVHADSPITSTAIYEAYLDVDMVTEALKNGLGVKVNDFLSSGTTPLDQKAAVINALYSVQGWEDRDLTEEYSLSVYGKKADSLDKAKLTPQEIFVLGYMKVLDHYLDPDLYWITEAKKASPDSMTVALIHALAVSQESLMCSWNNTEAVLADKSLKQDIRPEAIDIIVKYMELYKGERCQNGGQQQAAINSLVDDIKRDAIVLSIGQGNVLAKGKQTMIDDTNSKITPYLRKGTTMVPLRFISDQFGAAVQFDSKKHEVTIQYRNHKIIINEADSTISVNDRSPAKNTMIVTKNGRTFVPLRVIMDVFSKKTYYHRGLIIISDKLVLNPLNSMDNEAAEKIKVELAAIGSKIK